MLSGIYYLSTDVPLKLPLKPGYFFCSTPTVPDIFLFHHHKVDETLVQPCPVFVKPCLGGHVSSKLGCLFIEHSGQPSGAVPSPCRGGFQLEWTETQGGKLDLNIANPTPPSFQPPHPRLSR